MRLDIAVLYALAASPLATAAKWNSKAASAGYQYGAIVCAAGALICNSQGIKVGAYALGTAGFCCSTASASVTASESKGFQAAWKKSAEKLGAAAQVTKDGASKVGNFVAECSSGVCKMVARKKKGPVLPRSPRNRRERGGYPTNERRAARMARRSADGLGRRRLAYE
ncbi:unnamed protein product [Clonostachys solani]|uniref:Uncharacterized protein n=1 Tax=Clonostachys solani TaxID=160281 RepID=A0A9N9ZKY3_9HYPO|nr:unnamed protein product [Clonostachys solani]